jgi:hypothetical protein
MQDDTQVKTAKQLESTRRPGRLVTIRAAGGRGCEQASCFRQVRALVVEPNGDARVLALTHTRGAGAQTVSARSLFGGQNRRAA